MLPGYHCSYVAEWLRQQASAKVVSTDAAAEQVGGWHACAWAEWPPCISLVHSCVQAMCCMVAAQNDGPTPQRCLTAPPPRRPTAALRHSPPRPPTLRLPLRSTG